MARGILLVTSSSPFNDMLDLQIRLQGCGPRAGESRENSAVIKTLFSLFAPRPRTSQKEHFMLSLPRGLLALHPCPNALVQVNKWRLGEIAFGFKARSVCLQSWCLLL